MTEDLRSASPTAVQPALVTLLAVALMVPLGCRFGADPIGDSDGGNSDGGVSADANPNADAGNGTAAYLDRCSVPGDCATGLCVDDVGTTKFCTQTCSIDSTCADEHLCGGGQCVPDDTGAPCSIQSPDTCHKGLCLSQGDGDAFCTKECANANDCPAGYACTLAGGSQNKICVDVEKPCADANNCGTGLCLTAQGCTASCTTSVDCPRRLPFLAPYTCEIAFGSAEPICVPPVDVLGADPIGAACPAVGDNMCRSGACNTSSLGGPTCTQTCTAESGCGPGLGCFPLVTGEEVDLVCNRAGLRDLGETCAAAADCHSGLCDSDGFYCTRLCSDGLCPSDMQCLPAAGTGVSLCRRP